MLDGENEQSDPVELGLDGSLLCAEMGFNLVALRCLVAITWASLVRSSAPRWVVSGLVALRCLTASTSRAIMLMLGPRWFAPLPWRPWEEQ